MTVSGSVWSSLEPPLDEGESNRAVTNGSRSVQGPVEPPSSEPPTTPASSPFGDSHPGFRGTFITEDAVLSGSLEFQGQRLIMWGAGNPLLTWNPGECLLERLTANRFVLSSNGETITFTADDPDGLDSMLSVHPFGVAETPANDSESPVFTEIPILVMNPVPHPPQTSRWPARADLYPVPVEDMPPEPIETLAEPALAPVRKLEPVPWLPEPPALVDQPGLSMADVPITVEETPIRGRRPGVKAARASRAAAAAHEVGETAVDETAETVEGVEGATIAEIVTTRAAKIRKVRPRRFLPNDLQSTAIKVGFVSGAVVVVMGFAFAVLLILGEGDGSSGGTDSNSIPTTSIVTVPSTAPTTVTLPSTDFTTPVFDMSGPDFAERWNLLAAELDDGLLLSPNLSNPFSLVVTPYMTFDGILDALGGNLRLRAQPTGTVDGDRRILAAISLVIGTAEPSLTSEQRGDLVQVLGLDRDSDLGNINGAATYNGLLYEMDYLDEEGVLELMVRPEASVPTTAAP